MIQAQRNNRRTAPARHAGLTLIELILATAGVALIGLAVTSMLFATAYGSDGSRDMRHVVVQRASVTARLEAAVRTAQLILAQGDGYIVLWKADSRADGDANISELQRIEFDSGSGEILNYEAEFPDGWTDVQIEAADTGYALGSDFNTVTESLKSGSYFPSKGWGKNISVFSLSLDNVDPQSAALVSYRITIVNDQLSDDLIGAAGLLNAGG